MPRPLFPPHGVNVPTPLIYNAALSAPVFRTWIQLRGLAWESLHTPQFRMKQFARFVSKSPSTIYGHMAILRSLGAMSWRSYRNGTLTVSFPKQEMDTPPVFQNSGILESASLKDLMNTNENFSNKREPPFLESKKLEKLGSLEGAEPVLWEFNQTQLDEGPIGIYRGLTKIKPNQAQRRSIIDTVKDYDLWYACLDHWLAHKWSPANIPGMLELYQRGGPDHCRYCRKEDKTSTIEIINELRKEAKHGKS